MQILQVISHYIPAYRFGGPLQVAHSLGQSFVQLGHEVTVCTTNQADESSLLQVPVDVPVDVDGVQVYYEPISALRYWGFSTRLWRRAAVEIAKADIVLVHAHYQFANWVGARIARRMRKPYIIFAHGSLHQKGIQSKSQLLKRLYLETLERKNLRRAYCIAFNAPEEQAQSLFSNLGQVIPSGINPADFAEMPVRGSFRQQHPETRGKTLLLFLGRLDIEQKGLDLAIPAFANAIRINPNLHLVLAGPDENNGAAQLRQLITQYGISDAVTMTGLITGADKLAALRDADLFFLPSRFEGLSIALLEALYVGLPVLATDTVGLSEEIAQIGAGIVIHREAKEITQALLKLGDPEIRTAMRGRGTELISKKYTWRAIADNFIQSVQPIIAAS